ncbi:arsenate reductase ArsC [Streptomyces sp. NPDC026672]|uniref:arsenate reductase ArsC n=1 Tax=unclassified Streptomyces TaxID=2593676 RepID=UPI0033EFBB56
MTSPSGRPSVLFVCVHNAGRSQMAAAFLSRLAGDRVDVRSAGSAPVSSVNPTVVAVMSEVGINLSTKVPKVLTTEDVQMSDVVITMGCGNACPVLPGRRYLDWDLPDPAGRRIDAVRPIRDEIEKLVRGLLDEITENDASNGSAEITGRAGSTESVEGGPSGSAVPPGR